MKEKIDLHTHTTASDGLYSPRELIDYAVSKNLLALAITDHDTIDGLKNGMEYAKNIDFKLIPGIELSIDYSGGTFHLLGLDVDIEHPDLLKIIEEQKKNRNDRGGKIVADLANQGIFMHIDEVRDEALGAVICKAHIARVMVKKNYCKDIDEVFQNYMKKGKPGYVKKEKISLHNAISVIKKSGGIPILAHPLSLKFETFIDFEKMLQGYIKIGMEGLEVFSSYHNEEEIDEFNRLALKYDLLISGGSDFHGDEEKEIGVYSKDKYILIEKLNIMKKIIKIN